MEKAEGFGDLLAAMFSEDTCGAIRWRAEGREVGKTKSRALEHMNLGWWRAGIKYVALEDRVFLADRKTCGKVAKGVRRAASRKEVSRGLRPVGSYLDQVSPTRQSTMESCPRLR